MNKPHKDSNKTFSIIKAPVFLEEDGRFITDITKLYTTTNKSMPYHWILRPHEQRVVCKRPIEAIVETNADNVPMMII